MYSFRFCLLCICCLVIACHGKCPMSTIFAFVQNPSVMSTMSFNGSYYLPTDGIDNTTVLSGAFVPMQCNSGYVNTNGQLNITCVGDTWTTFPTCTSVPTSNLLMTGSAVSMNTVPCQMDNTSYTITNGYYSNQSISFVTSTAATGWIQFSCMPGYALDPSIGGMYICTNGVWSTKPRCLITGRCSFSTLQTFVSNSVGMQPTGQSQLMQLPQETNLVLSGSYIVLTCMNGYTNVGGSLNVTCGTSGTWSPFPQCSLNSGSHTTLPSGNTGSACPFDSTTYNITNGYYSNQSLSFTSSNTVTGWIQFSCVPGYALDPSVGAMYICNNGAWSTKPRCLITGRCSFSTLQTFVSNSVGMQPTGQSQLMQLPQETNLVLSGSYIVLTCMNGYTNVGGSLNVTCGTSGTWSPFPQCSLNSGSLTTLPSGNTGSACPFDSTTYNITNGYYSNQSLSFTSSNTVTGWIQFSCVPGYALDPSVGAMYICNNGAWSTKPRCLITGRCSFSTLQTFVSNSVGMQPTGQSQLMQLPQETNLVLSGSYIVLTCMNGYTNVGGSLNVTCGTSGTWSPFPQCSLNSGSLTTLPSGNTGSACPFDSTTYNITNGYYSNQSLSFTSSNTVTGWIQFSCVPGYVLDPSVGAMYICNNGAWSTKPRCLITGRCSFSTLQTFVSNSVGMQPTGQSQLMQLPQETNLVLSGSYIVLTCMNGYTNVGGSLNVTCGTSGTWSPFPQCSLNSGSLTTLPSGNTGSACPFDSTAYNITNGYYSNQSLSFTSSNTVTGWIQFSCVPGYALDPSVGGMYICSNGVWSTKPRCLITGRCSLSALQSFLGNAAGIQTTGQSQLMQIPQEPNVVLNGSYIILTCVTGYMNAGGSLNVTCADNGSWSPFPNCVTSAQTTMAPTTSTGVPCPYSANLLAIANGYASSMNGLMSPTPNQALSGAYIYYICNPSYSLVGNSLMTCSNGVWSTQPTCRASDQNITTTMYPSLKCGDVPVVANSYVSSATSIQYNNSIYQRRIEYTCNAGYTRVSTSGQNVVWCINGVWDPLPICGASPSCPVNQLQSALVNVELVSKSLYAGNGGILAGGWIQLRCASGYTLNPISGSLNITCLSTGQWSVFPICSK